MHAQVHDHRPIGSAPAHDHAHASVGGHPTHEGAVPGSDTRRLLQALFGGHEARQRRLPPVRPGDPRRSDAGGAARGAGPCRAVPPRCRPCRVASRDAIGRVPRPRTARRLSAAGPAEGRGPPIPFPTEPLAAAPVAPPGGISVRRQRRPTAPGGSAGRCRETRTPRTMNRISSEPRRPRSFTHPIRLALAASVAWLPTAHAQPVAAPASAASAPPGVPRSLDTVVITGNPLRSRQMAAPVSVLAGDELVLRRGSSLGETLDGLPGVSSTYFGPNANRPVIRGLDGDRVRGARQRRRGTRRLVAQLRPRGADRSADRRAHRGAARPGRAVLRRQCHRRCG